MLCHHATQSEHPTRVVVVGASGFVGGAVAARLERDGIPVLRVARRDIDLLAPDAAQRLGSLLRAGDVLVAAAAIAPCKTPDMLRDNVALAVALAKAAGAVELAQFVNISSDAVYADSPQPLTEESVTAPETLHGIMHLAREVLFKTAITAPLVILRPSLLYGVRDPHDGYGPNRFRRLANRGEVITLFGAGEERRDHVAIDDLAELAARIIAQRSTGVLNVATGIVTSFHDIAEQVVRLSRKAVPIRISPRSGPMPHNGYRPFDIAACRAAFPDFAYTGLKAGLAQAQREDRRAT
jgi:UDP-glucose 4-epimerase